MSPPPRIRVWSKGADVRVMFILYAVFIAAGLAFCFAMGLALR